MDNTIESIPKLHGYNCFACGTANPIGLNLQFYKKGAYVCSDLRLGKNFEGWENMAHGGIVSTLLDEIMSWAMIYFKRVFFVTRSIQIKYKHPVPLQSLLTVKGTILEGERKRLCRAKGLIYGEEKNILVKAEATFAILSDKDLYLVPDRLKRDMNNLFEKFQSINMMI